LKRSYDFEELGRRYGFDPRQVEKVCRISDFLEDLSRVPFLRDRLCLYGGTALSFVFFDEVFRLSVDVDFNYRHLDSEDWGRVRERVDDGIKRLLYSQGYVESDLAISASYPLGRITVQYRNLRGLRDGFEVEIGYMRRTPILHGDSIGMFRHIGSGESFSVKTPVREELFANKWCTLLYRGSSRDLFDIFQISKAEVDREVFRKCAVVDSLMRGYPRLYEVDVDKVVRAISIDTGLRNLLQIDKARRYDFTLIREEVLSFSTEILKELTFEEKETMRKFFEEHTFDPTFIDDKGILNEGIQAHPMIQRTLELLKREDPM